MTADLQPAQWSVLPAARTHAEADRLVGLADLLRDTVRAVTGVADVTADLHAGGDAAHAGSWKPEVVTVRAVAGAAGRPPVVVPIVSERGEQLGRITLRPRDEEISDDALQGVRRLAVWMATTLSQRDALADRDAVVAAWQRSEERFTKGFVHSPIGMSITDSEGRYVMVNDSFGRMLGHAAVDMIGRDYRPFTHPDDLDTGDLQLRRLNAGEVSTFQKEKRYLRRDGTVVHALINTTAVWGEGGRLSYCIHLMQDVTERKAMLEELRRTNALLSDEASTLEMIARGAPLTQTLEHIARTYEEQFPDSYCAIAVTDVDGVVTELAAPALDRVRGLALVHRTGGADGVAADRVVTLPVPAPAGGGTLGTFAVLRGSAGDATPAERACAGRCVRLTAIAIERSRAEEDIRHRALHDQLTGLPNRLLLMERLGHLMSRRAHRRVSVAMLFIDVDRFKVVNDSLGHHEGDQLLVALGRRLTDAVGEEGTVARFGGDEFVVLCEDVADAPGAAELAERVAGVLATPFRLAQRDVTVTASIGIAVLDDSHLHPSDLVRDADAAMYAAKEQGRNRSEVFDSAMRAKATRRLETEIQLRKAVDANELFLLYQPIVGLEDGRIIGAEALARWRHPTRGLVPPSEFIQIAEDTGLIMPIGRWVLEEAARQARRWRRLGRPGAPFTVAVNISARQLIHDDLVGLVTDALAATGADAGQLSLEITESVAMDEAHDAVERMRRVRDLGCRISVDDFGTGYSSLAYLRRLPVDTLKIDRAFITALDDGSEGAAIVAAVVEMARQLSLRVVAEGVETLTQLDRLRALRCDAVQGYLFARPLTPRRLANMATWWGQNGKLLVR